MDHILATLANVEHQSLVAIGLVQRGSCQVSLGSKVYSRMGHCLRHGKLLCPRGCVLVAASIATRRNERGLKNHPKAGPRHSVQLETRLLATDIRLASKQPRAREGGFLSDQEATSSAHNASILAAKYRLLTCCRTCQAAYVVPIA